MYRKTFVNIDTTVLENNIKDIKKKYPDYKYYIGVVKADSYGHNSEKVIKSIIEGGCNYLAVSSLDEAMEIRKYFDIPILCLGIINPKYMDICEKNNIDVTVTNIDYLKEIKNYKLNIHIKIDTGMNRIGVKDKSEFNLMIDELKTSNLNLKGIFTHIYEASNKENTINQIDKFKNPNLNPKYFLLF